MSQSDHLLLRSTTFTFNKWHTKAKRFSFSFVVLIVKGKCAILHKSGRHLLYLERMYLNIIAFEKMNIVSSEKGRLHYFVKVVGLFVCVCVLVLCVGAWVCDINLTTITNGIINTDLQKLFTFNYFDMLQNYCNVSQTYTSCYCVGHLLLKTSYCTF